MKLLLIEIIVCFFAGMGAGLGTGFAGMSAALNALHRLHTFMGPYRCKIRQYFCENCRCFHDSR